MPSKRRKRKRRRRRRNPDDGPPVASQQGEYFSKGAGTVEETPAKEYAKGAGTGQILIRFFLILAAGIALGSLMHWIK